MADPVFIHVDPEGRIHLPDGMTFDEAQRHLRAAYLKVEGTSTKREDFDVMPFEGAFALREALRRVFGDVWSGDENTDFRLQVGPNEYVVVPWGDFTVPGFEGVFDSDIGRNDNGQLIFRLTASFKTKYEAQYERVIAEMRAILGSKRLYAGMAIKVSFRDADGDLIAFIKPEILDVMGAVMPIYNEKTERRITGEILNIVTRPHKMRLNRVSLKRGAIIGGQPGTGKTLLGLYIARLAVENGWTFIQLPDARDFALAYELAKSYAPCVLFVEDIDRVTSHRRDAGVDKILNTIDGMDAKDDEVLTIMTTNHVEQIVDAMLRPGRADSKIFLAPYDEEAGLRALAFYTEGTLDPKCDLRKLAKHVVGMTGAEVRSLVDRARIYSVGRNVGEEETILTHQDIVDAALSLQEESGQLQSQQHPAQSGMMVIEVPEQFAQFMGMFSTNGRRKKETIQ